ncbi:MAG: serine/threonine-protein kinase [Streptosporangiaceae bacterium]
MAAERPLSARPGMWRVPGYSELKELGAGVRGRAVVVRHDHSGRPYVIRYVTAHDPAAQRRFQAESALLQHITSRYVARWHGHLDQGPHSAILMEAVNGVSLREILARQVSLSPESSLLVLKGALLGLASAHLHGVVHRGCRPANIVVRGDGLAKLIDFGIATLVGPDGPAYQAPEQWTREAAGPATDLYAATCMFYECLIGRPPFAGTAKAHRSAPRPLHDVPDELRGIVSAGLARSMDDRPPSAATFVAELDVVAEATYGPRWEEVGRKLLGGTAGSLTGLFTLDKGPPKRHGHRGLR